MLLNASKSLLLILQMLFGASAFQASSKFLQRWTAIKTCRREARAVLVFSALQNTVSTNSNSTMEIAANRNSDGNDQIPSNRELVERRLAVQRATREDRQRALHNKRRRNLLFKTLLQNGQDAEATATATAVLQSMYNVKVTVCNELREEMKLSGRERRGRVVLEADSRATRSIDGLRLELYGFFRALKKGTFVLQAGYPILAKDGSIQAEQELNDDNCIMPLDQLWDVETDEDVIKTFAAADAFFADKQHLMKRPSITIFVQKNPAAPKPSPPPAYLNDMPDPAQTTTMTMLSFYSFPPGGIDDPDAFAQQLRTDWKPFAALGRVYVANEGVNAQMAIPTNVLNHFVQCCRSIPELGTHMENGINIDPIPLTLEEFAVAGAPQSGGATDSMDGGTTTTPSASPPFKNLHVRVRRQIVADGLGKSLNWQSAGYDMPPLEWHEKLKIARDATQRGEKGPHVPLILDCRNTYESDVGIFEGAEPLGTTNFRDSWDALKERLAGVPKDAPIMTYCTGGIRCVKVGAYLTQEMGYTNVSRLAGGIIAYDRTLREQGPEKEEPMFKGTNFVFDGRLGRPITEDAMGICVTCGFETSLVSNCRNGNCHKRIIQCETCRTSFHGTCSDACRIRLLHGAMRTTKVDELGASTASSQEVFSTLDDYSTGHSTPPPSLYKEMEFNTKALLPSGTHLVSGETQGRLLKQLASMTRTARVLELGTFTGYATACLLEGVANAVKVIECEQPGNRQQGPYVMTMERDGKAFDVSVAQMRVVVKHGFGEAAAEELCKLRNSGDELPTTTEDVVSLSYNNGQVGCDLVHVSDALATLEEMAAGQGSLVPGAPFDLIFVDADKTRLYEYVDACLSSDVLLNKGGMVVVDNVLWKGLVLEAGNNGEFHSLSSDEEDAEMAELRKNRRARKLAQKMHQFNNAIAADPRAEVLVLPLRDGLSMIRKK